MSGAVSSRIRYGRAGIVLGLLLVCLAVRLIALHADPPAWLSWSAGLYTDEGFYTLDARHVALFGTAAPGNFHDRLLSPLLSLIQQAVFSICGSGLLTARLISVAFGMATILIFGWALRRAYNPEVALAGMAFLGLAPPCVFYNRLALQETPTVFWLVLAFALWGAGRKTGRYAVGSGISLALALIFKSLAAMALPGFLILACIERPRVRFLVLGLLGMLLVYGALWYWPHREELVRMTTYYRVHQIQPHSLLGLWLNIRRGLTSRQPGLLLYMLMTLPVPCVLAGYAVAKRRDWTSTDWLLTGWLGGGLLFCLISSYAPSRYYVLFLPALAGLAARGLMTLRGPLLIGFIMLFVLISTAWYGAFWAHRSTSVYHASQAFARAIPPGSIVVGEFAPTLSLETKFRAAPIQFGLSNDQSPVENLHADYVVVTRAPIWGKWWHAHYPDLIQPTHHIATFVLGDKGQYTEDVYRVESGP